MRSLDFELSKRNLERGALIYQANTTFVYNGRYKNTTDQVAIKVMSALSTNACGVSKREYEHQMKISHKNILQIFDYFYFSQTKERYVMVLILQFVDKDVYKEIGYRKRNNFQWTDKELLDITSDLINVLALLQQNGIAHRDIKPQNLFIEGRNHVMLGDFGSSIALSPQESEYSITGTPFYMSPELKQLLMGHQSSRAMYSPVKSDVYSLGITLLCMVKLEPPISLSNLANLSEMTALEIQAVGDSQLRKLLTKMLIIDPKHRPDFQQLAEFLASGCSEPHYSQPISQDCSHVAGGETTEYYVFECHGRFCRQCVPSVSFLRCEGLVSWYKVVCPVCLAEYEWHWTTEARSSETEALLSEQNQQPQISKEEMTIEKRSKSNARSESSVTESVLDLCVLCSQPVSGDMEKSDYEVPVVLECQHKFCSQKCFVNYYEMESQGYKVKEVHCPKCPAMITQSFAASAYGGELLFSRATEPNPGSRLCTICRSNISTHQLHETHWYCEGCYRFLCQPQLERTVHCSDCLSTLRREYLRRSGRRRPQGAASGGCCCWAMPQEQTDDGDVVVESEKTTGALQQRRVKP